MWGLSIASAWFARVKSAGRSAATAAPSGLRSPITRSSSAAISGPAPTIAPNLSADGLKARAVRVCNRNPRLVARYLETHALLMTGKDR
jgi:hypothetical protein